MILYNDGKNSYNYNPNEKPQNTDDSPKTGFELDGGRMLTAKNLENRVADWRRKNPVTYEKVEGKDGSIGLRVVRKKSENSPEKEPTAKNSENTTTAKSAENKSGDPIRGFLKDMGFEGDPKIEYTVTVRAPNGALGEIRLPTFGMIKKFIEKNTGNKKLMVVPNKNGQLYKIDYDPAVYAWSGGLSTEDQDRLEEAFEEATIGADMKMDPEAFNIETPKAEETGSDKIDSEKIAEVKESLGMPSEPNAAEKKAETPQKPEVLAEKAKKAQNYESHKKSAEATVRMLRDAEGFKENNDIEGSLKRFESTLTNMTIKANEEDLEKLRGQPIDFKREQQEFEIEDSAMNDYIRLREAQNELVAGKTVKDVTNDLEKKLYEEYGVERVDLSRIKTLKELNDLKVPVILSAEVTEDPKLVGTIKQINGIGFHIPGVPLYSIDGKNRVTNVINKDIKTGPSVVVYRAKDKTK